MNMLEADLIKKCKLGDKEAFGNLYDQYIQKIYRFVYYKVLSKEVAEDIVSDVFMKAMNKISDYQEGKGNFSSWLYQIARNTTIDYFRAKKYDSSIEDIFDLGIDERQDEKLDAKDLFSKISSHLDGLSRTQREIVMLRIWENLSYKEIADIVGVSEGSAKTSFWRALKDIRSKFDPVVISLLILVHLLK